MAHDAWWLKCSVLPPLWDSAANSLAHHATDLEHHLQTFADDNTNPLTPAQVQGDIGTVLGNTLKGVRAAMWNVCRCPTVDFARQINAMKDTVQRLQGINPQQEAANWLATQLPDFQTHLAGDAQTGKQNVEDARKQLEGIIRTWTDTAALQRVVTGNFSDINPNLIDNAFQTSKTQMSALVDAFKARKPDIEDSIRNTANTGANIVCSGPSGDIITDLAALCIAGPLFLAEVPAAVAADAALKAARKLPPPLDTLYDPVAAAAAGARTQLASRAETYEQWLKRFHLSEGQVVGCVEVNLPPPGPLDIGQLSWQQDCMRGKRLTNAGSDTGQYLGALAHKYAITQSEADLESLRTVLWGYYNVVTIAGDINGKYAKLPPQHGGNENAIVQPNIVPSGQRPQTTIEERQAYRPMAGNPGLPVRFYASSHSRYFNDRDLNHSGDKAGQGAFEIHATLNQRCAPNLLGNPGQGAGDCGVPDVYRFMERQSSDDDYWLLWGALAAYDTLKAAGKEREWQKRIATATANFGVYLVNHGLAIQTMDNQPAGNTGGFDLLPFLSNLAFLKAAVYLADQEGFTEGTLPGIDKVRSTYREKALAFTNSIDSVKNQTSVGPSDPWVVAASTLYPPILLALDEVVWLFVPRWILEHYVPAMYILMHYETDAPIWRDYAWFAEKGIMPMAETARDPLLDMLLADMFKPEHWVGAPPETLFVPATANGEVLSVRATATLYQFRDLPAPFGRRTLLPTTVPHTDRSYYYTDYRERTDLINPLFAFAKSYWEDQVRTMVPDFWQTLDSDTQNKFANGPFGIWPLGPGLVPKPLPEVDPYFLIGGSPMNIDVVFGTYPHPDYSDTQSVFDTPGMPQTVELFSENNFLAAYWLGRHRGLIPPVPAP
ncbi:MAG: hypothetical protein ABSA59_05525 [Terriglobia bacterium]